MNFNIRMGIPEMQELWLDLQEKYRSGNIKKKEEQLYKKWGKALKLLSADPGYPSLQTHEIEPLSRRYGMKVWQSYLENKTSGAMRMYWVYGPDQKDITIIGLEPHPEDKKMAHTTEFHCRICRIKLNMHVPSRFYYKVYEEKRDFYEQFYERLEEAKNF